MGSRVLCLTLLSATFLGICSAREVGWEDLPPSAVEFLQKQGVTLEQLQKAYQRRAEEDKLRAEEEKKEKPPAETIETNEKVETLPPVPRPWPQGNRYIPLQTSVVTEKLDGFAEQTTFCKSPQVSFSFRNPSNLVASPDQSGCSARLVDRNQPGNQLEIFLFPRSLFLPAVTQKNLEGFFLTLTREHEDRIELIGDDEFLPRNTFKVGGQPWGKISYKIKTTPVEVGYTDFFAMIDSHTLVFRLSGSEPWVAKMTGRIKGALSGLDKE